MAESETSRKKIDAYLRRLAEALAALPEEQARDIVEELRCHLVDKISALDSHGAPAGGVAAELDAVFARLGTPEEIAGQYVELACGERQRVRAPASRPPVLPIAEKALRCARQSLAGLLLLLGSLGGYFVALSLICCALLRPLHPHTAGLWKIPDAADDLSLSLRMGFGSVPPGSRDLLGAWIVPIGIIAGLGLFFLTMQFGRWSLRDVFRPRRARAVNVF
ncbi:MAG: hypothetical protein ABSG16_01345 [Candidatus Acidiferrum sp.]|jgi:hypothetical protein